MSWVHEMETRRQGVNSRLATPGTGFVGWKQSVSIPHSHFHTMTNSNALTLLYTCSSYSPPTDFFGKNPHTPIFCWAVILSEAGFNQNREANFHKNQAGLPTKGLPRTLSKLALLLLWWIAVWMMLLNVFLMLLQPLAHRLTRAPQWTLYNVVSGSKSYLPPCLFSQLS